MEFPPLVYTFAMFILYQIGYSTNLSWYDKATFSLPHVVPVIPSA